MIGLILGVCGIVIGAPGVKREWGLGAATGFVSAGILVALFVPFGGIMAMLAGGGLHRLAQNRNMDRIAAEADREFQASRGLPLAQPAVPPYQPSDNPFEPPRTS